MKAMILAAGRGERMRPLTNDTPKPLLKVGERSLIEYHLLALANAGITEIVINVSYQPQQFVAILGDGAHYGVKIHYSFEPENCSLETGGGIFKALPLLGSKPFIAVSADLFTDYPFATLPSQLNGLAHLIFVDNPDFHPQGDFCLQGDKVIAEGENKLNFAGIGVYDPALFADCKPGKFALPPLWKVPMAQGLITGEYYRGVWWNLGNLAQLQALRKLVAENVLE